MDDKIEEEKVENEDTFDKTDEISVEEEPKKEDTSEDASLDVDIDPIPEEDNSSSPSPIGFGGNKELKRKLILIMGGIMGIFIVVGLIMGIASIFRSPSYTYEDVEDVMKDAAKDYFSENKKKLPNDKQIVEITSTILINNEYMDDFTEYLGEEASCSGKVSVKKVDGKYVYIPYLNCGSEYNTTELYKKLKKQVVTSGEGLYSVNSGYIYRGEKLKNYVKLGKKKWRAVKISGNDEVMLILNSAYENSTKWDDRFNVREGYNAGINDYKASRVREFLKTAYRDKDKYTKFLNAEDKAKMVKFDVCIGKRSVGSTVKDNSAECSEILTEQRIGLLTVSDYMFASLDPNCKKDTDPSCQNYNYLATDYEWILGTASKNNTTDVFYINDTGEISTIEAMTDSDIRPVIMLSSDTMVKGGKGTKSKPYIVK